jgi:hypothetical protein
MCLDRIISSDSELTSRRLLLLTQPSLIRRQRGTRQPFSNRRVATIVRTFDSSPDGIRTRVSGLKGQRPRPLDDGANAGEWYRSRGGPRTAFESEGRNLRKPQLITLGFGYSLFQGRDLFQAASVAVFAGELRGEEGAGQVFCQRRSDDPRAQAKDVDVVVFHHLMSRVGVMGDRSSDSPHLVGGHASPGPGATDQHRSDRFAIQNRTCRGHCRIRIVHRIGVVGPEIEHRMTLIGQKFGQVFLEFEPGVIGGDGYSHVDVERYTTQVCPLPP